MAYEDYLIRESVGDGTIDPDDVCIVCDRRDCVCPAEDEDIGGNVIPDRVAANHDHFRAVCSGDPEPDVSVPAGSGVHSTNLANPSALPVGAAECDSKPDLSRIGSGERAFNTFPVPVLADPENHGCEGEARESTVTVNDKLEATEESRGGENSFSQWLEVHGDHLRLPTAFSEWLQQNGDSI